MPKELTGCVNKSLLDICSDKIHVDFVGTEIICAFRYNYMTESKDILVS